jgi:hypothetical protein
VRSRGIQRGNPSPSGGVCCCPAGLCVFRGTRSLPDVLVFESCWIESWRRSMTRTSGRGVAVAMLPSTNTLGIVGLESRPHGQVRRMVDQEVRPGKAGLGPPSALPNGPATVHRDTWHTRPCPPGPIDSYAGSRMARVAGVTWRCPDECEQLIAKPVREPRQRARDAASEFEWHSERRLRRSSGASFSRSQFDVRQIDVTEIEGRGSVTRGAADD